MWIFSCSNFSRIISMKKTLICNRQNSMILYNSDQVEPPAAPPEQPIPTSGTAPGASGIRTFFPRLPAATATTGLTTRRKLAPTRTAACCPTARPPSRGFTTLPPSPPPHSRLRRRRSRAQPNNSARAGAAPQCDEYRRRRQQWPRGPLTPPGCPKTSSRSARPQPLRASAHLQTPGPRHGTRSRLRQWPWGPRGWRSGTGTLPPPITTSVKDTGGWRSMSRTPTSGSSLLPMGPPPQPRRCRRLMQRRLRLPGTTGCSTRSGRCSTTPPPPPPPAGPLGCTRGTRGCGTTSSSTRSSSAATWPTAPPARQSSSRPPPAATAPRPPRTTAPCPPITRGLLPHPPPRPRWGRCPLTSPGTQRPICLTSTSPVRTSWWATSTGTLPHLRPSMAYRRGGTTQSTRRPLRRRPTITTTIRHQA